MRGAHYEFRRLILPADNSAAWEMAARMLPGIANVPLCRVYFAWSRNSFEIFPSREQTGPFPSFRLVFSQGRLLLARDRRCNVRSLELTRLNPRCAIKDEKREYPEFNSLRNLALLCLARFFIALCHFVNAHFN